MDDQTGDELRRVEVHFASDDEAMIVEIRDDPDASDVDQLLRVLDADDIREAERILGRGATGLRTVGRIGARGR